MARGNFSDYLGPNTRNNVRPTWHGIAFIMEALVLLLFITICLAIFMRLFGNAEVIGEESSRLETAIVLAEDAAESFAADPEAIGEGFTLYQKAYTVECSGTSRQGRAGKLYTCDIVVCYKGEELYTLQTSRYVSENKRSASTSNALTASNSTSDSLGGVV